MAAEERCESGKWSGEPCEAPHHDGIAVTFVPDEYRDMAAQLDSWRGLEVTILVCEACAERIAEYDPDWSLCGHLAKKRREALSVALETAASELKEALRKELANPTWTGADWEHEAEIDGAEEKEVCFGDIKGCEYCAEAKGNAQGALDHAAEALEFLKDGDFLGAADRLYRCWSIESDYGEAPTWGDFDDRAKELLLLAEELRNLKGGV